MSLVLLLFPPEMGISISGAQPATACSVQGVRDEQNPIARTQVFSLTKDMF